MGKRPNVVADFGAGTGLLGLGAALLGAKKIYLVEIDNKALEIAKQNLAMLEKKYGKLPVEFVNKPICEFNQKVDVVIQNPPFGVQHAHADREFLKKAFCCTYTIYSLHKIESKQFIQALAKDNGFKVHEILEFNFPLKASMKFHKQKVRNIRVGCWVLVRV